MDVRLNVYMAILFVLMNTYQMLRFAILYWVY